MGQVDNIFAYNGTAGFVQRETSIAQEESLRHSGETKERARRFLALLANEGAQGQTWKEIQTAYKTVYGRELHHGQISGLLTNLHKNRLVFISPKIKRANCFAYIAGIYRDEFHPEERFDSPVQTKAGVRRQALEKVLRQVRELHNDDWEGQDVKTVLSMILYEFDATVTED